MLKIGEFSKLAKTTVKTLRFYDKINLFKPKEVAENGYRYYNIDDLKIIQLIVEFREYGLPINEIKKILTGQSVQAIFEKHKENLKKQIQENQISLTLIEKLIEKYKKGDIMLNYQVKTKDMPECIVFYRHGIIKSMANIVEFILGAGSECTKNNPNLKCAKPDYCFVTYSAKEYQEKNVELEYAQAVENFGKESENIKFKKLPAQKMLTLQHKGPYTSLPQAYAFALNYVKENNLEIVDDIRECYIHGCWDTENDEEYLTEIQIPIK